MNGFVKGLPQIKKSDILCDSPVFYVQTENSSAYEKNLLYSHDAIEITLIFQGAGIHRIQDRDIPCKAGDIYVVNANIPHGYFVTEGEAPLLVKHLIFDPEILYPRDSQKNCFGIFSNNSIAEYAMLNSKTLKRINELISLILEENEKREDEWQNSISAHITLLLITLGRYINNTVKSLSAARGKNRELINSVIRMIDEGQGSKNITLEKIASELFVSTGRLSKLFLELTGKNFSEYSKLARLKAACGMLTETELTVKDIAERSGFKDISTFYKSFSSQIGMTPTQYREKEKIGRQKELKGKKQMVILSEISQNLQAGKAKIVKEMVEAAINEGISAERILNEGLIAGMSVVGEKFKNNEVFVPEVLVAARAMNHGAALLKPILIKEGVKSAGKVCIGTVQGDLHDIGKNLVKMMLEGKGFEVIDLGTDVPPAAFVDAVINENCKIVCCSALLTTTMGVMGEVIDALRSAGVRNSVKVLVGGAPVTQEFADSIGADGYSPDAATCAELALKIISE